MSLYEVDSFDEGLQAVRAFCDIAVLTRSAKGAVIVTKNELHVIDAAPCAEVIDTTGAGDLYAAGFLYGLTRGLDLGECGRIGAIAAAEVIGHYGARPEADLKALIQPALAD
jgi:sugar/nucleoside kinase (ribokinase family)